MNRVSFLVDGFNLYHSARKVSKDKGLGGKGTKWLDIHSLTSSYLHLLGRDARLEEVYYFSALAKHLESVKPEVTMRHRAYITCLRATGVRVELSRFKKKWVRCDSCGHYTKRHEEKETDVAIAAKLLELFVLDQCDSAVIMTGDTDLAPAVWTAQRLFPEKTICFAFPYGRKNLELKKLVTIAFQKGAANYLRYQLPDPFIFSDGSAIQKPASW